MSTKECYKILEVDSHASIDEIKSAFRKAALKYHPDINPSKEAAETFQLLLSAYERIIEMNQTLSITQTDSKELQNRAKQFDERFRSRNDDGNSTEQSQGIPIDEPHPMETMTSVLGIVMGTFIFSIILRAVTMQENKSTKASIIAWYNPDTKRWERPQPGDATYEAHKYSEMRVSIEDVYQGKE